MARKVGRSRPVRPHARRSHKRRSRRPEVPSRQRTSYSQELRASLTRWLPRLGLASADGRVRWTPTLLVICILLMVVSPAQTLQTRFADARLATVQMFLGRHRRRPGKTYEGFITALVKVSDSLLTGLLRTLRALVQEIAGPHWEVEGWALFGVDATKIECPQTQANEAGLGCAGKPKSAPQFLLTMLLHLGTGLPWAFARTEGTGSERDHLRAMLPLLPPGALLAMDAGYTGYEMLRDLQAAGMHCLIRVGQSTRLLRKLGYVREYEDTVYLWPHAQQGRRKDGTLSATAKAKAPPLVLRLIVLHDGRAPIYLLTSVCEPDRLPARTAAALYRRRWHLELYYRSLKQTLGRRKLLSDCPKHAAVELDWNMVGLWILGLMTTDSLIRSGHDPCRASAANALHIVQEARLRLEQRCARGVLPRRLATAHQDTYRRRGSKTARQPKPKKKERPPGRPQVRLATAAERQLARCLAEANNPQTRAPRDAQKPLVSRGDSHASRRNRFAA
jgi:hypothetical protein